MAPVYSMWRRREYPRPHSMGRNRDGGIIEVNWNAWGVFSTGYLGKG